MIGSVNLILFLLLMGKLMYVLTNNEIYFYLEIISYASLCFIGYLGVFSSKLIRKPYRLQSTYMYRKFLKSLNKESKKGKRHKKQETSIQGLS